MRFVASTTPRVRRRRCSGRTSRILPSSISTSAVREIADLAVEGQHDAALEQDAALPLQAGQVGVLRYSALRRSCAGQHLRGSAAGSGSGAGREERAA